MKIFTKAVVALSVTAAAAAITPAQAAVVLTTTTYTQDFNSLAATGTSNTLPTGFISAETGPNANALYTANTGSSNAGDTYSFGSAGSTDRALGGLRSGNLVPLFGAQFTNALGGTITSVAIQFTGELWRLGAISRSDSLTFQYSTNATNLTTGTFTNVAALGFTTPNLVGAVGARNGNLATNRTVLNGTISGLNIAQGSSFFIRWVDTDASGADDGLAVDDFSLTAQVLPAVPEPTTWALMLFGFGLVGYTLRRKPAATAFA